jgi:hypothetical protein
MQFWLIEKSLAEDFNRLSAFSTAESPIAGQIGEYLARREQGNQAVTRERKQKRGAKMIRDPRGLCYRVEFVGCQSGNREVQHKSKRFSTLV